MANEERSAERFVSAVLEQTGDFAAVRMYVILDRVSRDNTREILDRLASKEPRLRIVWAPENRCVVDAYMRGYREAIKEQHDYVLEIDGGFSHRPDDMAAFFDALDLGYDCVFGSRFVKGGRISDTPLSRRFISRGGTTLANLVLGTHLRDMTSGFELFSRAALIEILGRGIISRAHFFQTEIKFHARNMRIVEVPIEYSAASPSVSSASLKDAFKSLYQLVHFRSKP